MPRSRARFFTLSALALLIASSVFWIELPRAQDKAFWLDEANEMTINYPQTVKSLVMDGAESQCSPQPFYYVLQTRFLTAMGFRGPLLIWTRVMSLGSAFIILLISFWIFYQRFGLFGAVVGSVLVENQALFHQYAIETRPYALWTALFALSIALSLRGSRKALYLSQFGLVSTVKPGFLQATSLALARALGKRQKTYWRDFFVLAVFGLMIAFFYRHGCEGAGATNRDLNLLINHDPELIRSVVRILFPLVPTFVGPLLSLLTLAGFGVVFKRGTYSILRAVRTSRNQSATGPTDLPWFERLDLIFYSQIWAGIAIFFSVIIKGYYFVPRAFIFLIVLRPYFVLSGIELLVRYRRFAQIVLLVSVVGNTIYWAKEFNAKYPKRTAIPALTQRECLGLGQKSEIWYETGMSAVEIVNSLDLVLEQSRFCREKGWISTARNPVYLARYSNIQPQGMGPHPVQVYELNGQKVTLPEDH